VSLIKDDQADIPERITAWICRSGLLRSCKDDPRSLESSTLRLGTVSPVRTVEAISDRCVLKNSSAESPTALWEQGTGRAPLGTLRDAPGDEQGNNRLPKPVGRTTSVFSLMRRRQCSSDNSNVDPEETSNMKASVTSLFRPRPGRVHHSLTWRYQINPPINPN